MFKGKSVRGRGAALALGLFLAVGFGGCCKPCRDRQGLGLKLKNGPRKHGELLVALSFSGGGSRAAYFAQQILERLSGIKISVGGRTIRLIDEIDYISGASGGSLPAAYHALFWPEGKKNMADYFRRFRKKMSLNIQGKAIRNIFFSLKGLGRLLFTKDTRTDLLAETMDKHIFGGATWDRLQANAAKGLSPVIMLNTVIYTSERFGYGNKLVFSTLETKDYHIPHPGGRPDKDMADTVKVVSMQDLGIPLNEYKVTRSVTASAAFPVLIKPLLIRDRLAKKDGKVLLGDGGIYDNLGVESVSQRLVKVLENEDYPGALFIVVNAQKPFKFKGGLGVISALHAILERRARALSRIIFRHLSSLMPMGKEIHKVELALMKGAHNAHMYRKMRGIATAFKIKKRHQRLVERAANKLIRDNGGRIKEVMGTLIK